jgi:hypothetical protein
VEAGTVGLQRDDEMRAWMSDEHSLSNAATNAPLSPHRLEKERVQARGDTTFPRGWSSWRGTSVL